MKKILLTASMATTILLTACSTANVKPTYTSPSKYQHLDCQQIQNEFYRLDTYLEKGVKGSSLGGLGGIGISLGGWGGSGGNWGIMPSVSLNMGQLIGGSSKKDETARLLGEQEALIQAAKFKHCEVSLQSKHK